MRGSIHASATANSLGRFLRASPLGTAAAVLVVVAVVLALFAAQLAPYDPLRNDYTAARQSPSAQHLLGTDNLGRDVLSRIIYGLRVSLIVSVAGSIVWHVEGSPGQRIVLILANFTLFSTLILGGCAGRHRGRRRRW